MSIVFSGTFTRSSGVSSAIYKQLKAVNLKPIKKIQIQFDPFHQNAKEIREFLFHLTTPLVTETNLNCIIRTNIVCDRSDPQVDVKFANKKGFKILTNNLTTLEVLQQFNKYVQPEIKVEEVTELPVTKATKKKRK